MSTSIVQSDACDCGKRHARRDAFSVGDRVRIRVHWKHRHRTGTVTAARDGFGAERVYDVDLDANDGGPASLRAMGAWELWAEEVRA